MRVTSTIYCRSDPAVFGAVRRFVAQFVLLAGGSKEDAAELEVATGEVLGNAYRHAYRKTHGPLELNLRHDAQAVEVTVHDDGDAVTDMPTIPHILPTWAEHRGLYLIGKFTDHVDIIHPRSARGGTTVRMVKHINKLTRLVSILGLS